jgi:hypothetical protein
MTFKYSGCWNAVYYDNASSFSLPVVDLSDQTLNDPCTTSTGANGGLEVACGYPMHELLPGHILVIWSSISYPAGPNWSINDSPGIATTVGGRPAREQRTPGGCRHIGGDESISVDIAWPPGASGAYVNARACLRSPDEHLQEERFQQMLDSVTFHP